VPCDRLALAVKVRREVDGVGRLGLAGDGRELLLAILGNDVFGFEVVIDVDTQLALARVLGQVTDVTVRSQDPVAGAQISLDSARFCR